MRDARQQQLRDARNRQWSSNWEQWQQAALRHARWECRIEPGLSSGDTEELADEAIQAAWQDTCDNPSVDVTDAIGRAVSRIAKRIATERKRRAALPELPAHKVEYYAGEDSVRDLVLALPAKLQATALALAADPDQDNCSLADFLGCNEGTIRRHKREIAKRLGSRFSYWLLGEWQYSPAERLSAD